MFVLVFDTETTGLPKTKLINENTILDWPHIVQLSYIIYDTEDNKIIKISDSIINIPDNIALSKESIAIHGVDRNKMTELGKSIRDVISEFLTDINFIDLIVGHNIEFDINMIIVEIYRCMLNNDNSDTKEINLPIVVQLQYMNKFCTMKNSMKLCDIKKTNINTGKEYLKYPSLTETYNKLFGIKPNNMHNSLNDIYACLRCFYKLKYNKDICDENNEFNKLLQNAL
jgi:DNA polymerase III epsilon subunit-like protein